MLSTVELEKRVRSFQKILHSKNVDGALLVQRADTLYFTGTGQEVHAYLPSDGEPIVFAYRDVGRAQAECPWEVIPLPSISKLPQLISTVGKSWPKIMGLEYDVLPVAYFDRYRNIFTETKFVDISYSLRLLRAVKSDWEVAQIEQGCRIYSTVLEYMGTILRTGMTEVELETLLEAKARILGHEPTVRARRFGTELHFSGIVAGPRAAVPTYFEGPIGGLGVSCSHPIGPSHTPIKPGEAIVVDIGVVINGYHTDLTRMFVIGDISHEFEKAYESSLAIQELIRKSLVPGRVAGEIYSEIISWVQKETPYAANFMGFGSSQVRFVGHGIGLELDELPVIGKGAKEVLQPGMIIAIEPKFVFPGEGAIGIEDNFVVESEKGARCLSSASRKIVRVEP